ncbi:P-loop containing nucleoside triphosphate hydrolase protein [Coprinopsis marcescibilis]|nr:P-loop containing nucleoside triphosphate hydrolase protein [Coprinopsis marcescibilis]
MSLLSNRLSPKLLRLQTSSHVTVTPEAFFHSSATNPWESRSGDREGPRSAGFRNSSRGRGTSNSGGRGGRGGRAQYSRGDSSRASTTSAPVSGRRRLVDLKSTGGRMEVARDPQNDRSDRPRTPTIPAPVTGRRRFEDPKSTGGRREVARDHPPHQAEGEGARAPHREYTRSPERQPRRESHSRANGHRVPDRQSQYEPYSRGQGPRPGRTTDSSTEFARPGMSAAPKHPKPHAPLNFGSPITSPEFAHPPALVTTSSSSTPISSPLPPTFTSPPLLPGLLSSVEDFLGPKSKPTPIQALSLKWIMDYSNQDEGRPFEYGEFLLASETGSGKSFAYLLPVLQGVKVLEMKEREVAERLARGEASEEDLASVNKKTSTSSDYLMTPRAIILVPTHELARQISAFAKSLLHTTKLRVVCASQTNVDLKSTKPRTASGRRLDVSSRDMAASLDTFSELESGDSGESASPLSHDVDVLVGTPMKIMEMIRGRGWDLASSDFSTDDVKGKLRRGRDVGRIPAYPKGPEAERWADVGQHGQQQLGLGNIEWAVIDEADVLLDPDFQEVTRLLLSDVSKAKGHIIPVDNFPTGSPSPQSATTDSGNPVEYPFNFLLSTATIPSSLSNYLSLCHPNLLKLASPKLHKLPDTLKVDYVKWTGGNRFKDVERRIREVWAQDAVEVDSRRKAAYGRQETAKPALSKVLIFCNKSAKVQEMSRYLEENGILNVAVTSGREVQRLDAPTEDGTPGSNKLPARGRGSNKYLGGFLKPIRPANSGSKIEATDAAALTTRPKLKNPHMLSDPSTTPHVLITTSLLSRGLDFDPEVKNVFIVDEPRSMVDFLHRAGRSGRMGGIPVGGAASSSGAPAAAGPASAGGRAPGLVVIFGRGGPGSISANVGLSGDRKVRLVGGVGGSLIRKGGGRERTLGRV